MNISADPDLISAYQKSDIDLRLRHAKVGCVLSLILMPAGSFLDYFVYPQHLGPFFVSRVVTDVLIAAILLVLISSKGRCYIFQLGFVWAFLPSLAIAWMIYHSEGTTSPYYAGLNLVIIISLMLMPFRLVEAILFCSCVIGMYVLACIAYPSGITSGQALFNNLYFLSLTSIICCTASFYFGRRRIEDFRLRHEISESYKKLTELDKLKSEFFANISHEFRTPLTLIIAPLNEAVQRYGQNLGPAQEYVRTAQQNALRLLKLINDLLEIIRLDQGGVALKRERINLPEHLRGIADGFQYLASARNLSLKVGSNRSMNDITVEADPARLEKVFNNLIGNAIKFTPTGGTIRIDWDEVGDQIEVTVADTGCGIAKDQLPRIFERFHQADGSSTRSFQGAGIGLSLARDLVAEHGGTISVDSEPGEGTTLKVALPSAGAGGLTTQKQSETDDGVADVYREAEQRVGIILDDRDLGPNGPVEAGHILLVIDDEPDMRRFLVSDLARKHRVLQAADGSTGLALARETHPDLIVLDLMMAGMSGLDVCRAIKSEPSLRDIRILMLTAKADEQSKLTALERGADDFLTKPFSTVELRTRIANLLETRDLEVDLRNRNVQLGDTLDQLKNAEAQLVQSEKMNSLGSLSAGLMHEINNPLTYALTALQIARQMPPASDGDLRDCIDDAIEGMDRIASIVTDLRTFALPDHDVTEQTFDVEHVIDLALRLTANEYKHIEVTQDVDDRLQAHGATTQVSQVLVNLLTNSAQVQATRVYIAAKCRGDRINISVSDNGPGIPETNLARIFEPFFTTMPVGQGTGLGLSICHAIVKRHGGTLSVQNRQGKGAVFTFDLSLAAQGAIAR